MLGTIRIYLKGNSGLGGSAKKPVKIPVADFNPVRVFRQAQDAEVQRGVDLQNTLSAGQEALRDALAAYDDEELYQIARKIRLPGSYTRKTKREQLLARIMSIVETRATQGNAFYNYPTNR